MSSSSLSPKVSLNIVGAKTQKNIGSQRLLFIGQMLTIGTAMADKVVSNVPDSDVDTLFGVNSILAMAIKKARAINKYTQIDAIGLADATSGKKASASILFTGTATVAQQLSLFIGSKSSEIKFDVSVGDDATKVASSLEALIQATDLPFTASATSDTLSLEFKHSGVYGNSLQIRLENVANGIGYNITPFSGGAGSVDASNAISNIVDRYQTIIFQDKLDTTPLVTLLEQRWTSKNNVLDGVAIVCQDDDTIRQENSLALCVLANTDKMKFLETSFNISAEVGAIRALRLTEGANLIGLVYDTSEVVGGIDKVTLPYFNTPLSLGKPKGLLSSEDVKQLEDNGLCALGWNGTSAVLTDLITTYKTDVKGNKDLSWKFLNYVDAMSAVREVMLVRIKDKFGQTRITTDKKSTNGKVKTVDDVASYIRMLYKELIDEAVVQGGEEEINFAKNLNVVLNGATGAIDIAMEVKIVIQAREFNGLIALSI